MRLSFPRIGRRAAVAGTAAALCALAPLATPPADAQDAVANPCAYGPIDLGTYGFDDYAAPAVLESRDGVLETTLTVGYNESTIAGCPVDLRNYNGGLVGPTLRVQPGDVMRITLSNTLPPNPGDAPADHNIPHDFNTTNLHTHGLHVSPRDNSDNVLLEIEPGVDFDYEIAIPDDHPPGSFWYHAHFHGSTALQVSSGMAGALIIEGGLDDVPQIADAADQVMVFQQIAYDEAGVIESYDHFGPGNWVADQRQTLINGQVAPTIEMRPGEVQRWRMIHAGVREALNPTLRLVGGGIAVADLNELEGPELTALPIAAPLHEIAVDGLALGRIDSWQEVELLPGYRSDVLVKAPMVDQPLTLLLTDGDLSTDDSLLGVAEPERVLARIQVRGEPMDMPLPTEAELAPLLPHPPITDDELDGAPQSVHFDIASMACPVVGEPCVPCEEVPGAECKTRFMINEQPYNMVNVRELQLGTASEWTLSSGTGSHPFHIHVNPFQTTRTGPDGEPQTVWRDTLFVRSDEPAVTIRSRYERYTGKFVLHCHILDHEDQGMMQIVEIVE
jgi:FtsP/CotA-like multicopper oxidase with cupredoxin domain